MTTFAGYTKETLPRGPRPREPCPECAEPLVLKWGDTRRPYFAHLSKSECKGGGEAFVHKKAKEYLCEALNRGEEITFKYSCTLAPHTHTIPLKLNDGEVAKTEVKVGNGFADIGVLDKDGNVRFIVEICNTHRTQARDGEWVEVDAEKVIQYVVKQQAAHLTCIRKRAPSTTAPCWKNVWENFHCKGRNFGFKGDAFSQETLWEEFCQLGRCIDCFKCHPVEKYRPFCRSCWKSRFASNPSSQHRSFFTQRGAKGCLSPEADMCEQVRLKKTAIDALNGYAISNDDVSEAQRLVETFHITGEDIRDKCTLYWAAKYTSWSVYKWLAHRFATWVTADDITKALIQAGYHKHLAFCKWLVGRFSLTQQLVLQVCGEQWMTKCFPDLDEKKVEKRKNVIEEPLLEQNAPKIHVGHTSQLNLPALKQRRIDDYFMKK